MTTLPMEVLPTGVAITPLAAAGATFQALRPGLPEMGDRSVDHAVTTALSPDGATLLVLTSGYNRYNDVNGERIVAASREYVFVFDVAGGALLQKQVVTVANAFTGLAWNPSGREFYVSGGVDDDVHFFEKTASGWIEAATVPLSHPKGIGPDVPSLAVPPMAAGLAVDAGGRTLVVVNYENDSISLLDIVTRTKTAELDLRPGKHDPKKQGTPGGEYPVWVAVRGESTAYISSERDDEVVVVDISSGRAPVIRARIPVGSAPGRMVLNPAGTRLFVADANSDSISVIATESGQVIEQIPTSAVSSVMAMPRGANPNSIALSPDGTTLFVTNGGMNALAVIALGGRARGRGFAGREPSRLAGLVPTGWYPSSATVSADGTRLFVVNGKSNAGPNQGACRRTDAVDAKGEAACRATNQYVWQLEKAGLLTLPVPAERDLVRLTRQTATNNRFGGVENGGREETVMRAVKSRIKHVVFVVKENRSYDQVLGDVPGANGDPRLALFPQSITPNHHALAKEFVTLDGFFDSGESSGVGWNWTMAGRTTDATEKAQPVSYAGRGFSYDWEGVNRNVNVGLATARLRALDNPYSPTDPDILPGTRDIASHAMSPRDPSAYLWDAAIAKGLVVRNYGCFGDTARYELPTTDPAFAALERAPAATHSVQFFPTKESLRPISDPYFRGFDMRYPDYYRVREWEREFDEFAAKGTLPHLSLVRLPHDHLGDFADAMDGVTTPETQIADNDYALGRLVEKVAKSPFRNDTLVFVIEDDAQNGPDHVDAHRSVALVAGPLVRRGVVVSRRYDTVSMLRTIEDVLGLDPMGLTDAFAPPMADVFDENGPIEWDYRAQVPPVLRTTKLPLPPPTPATSVPPVSGAPLVLVPRHDTAYWQRLMRGQNFRREDDLDTDRFNRALWQGIRGSSAGYPSFAAEEHENAEDDEESSRSAREQRR